MARCLSDLGTSKNAIMTQLWIAMCTYLLLAYAEVRIKNSMVHTARYESLAAQFI